jgi:transcriptional regulator with XRE-family HTH domain
MMDTSIVDRAQKRIIGLLKHAGISIKDVADEARTPYSTAREMLTKPGRLSIPWLNWYAGFFGITTDYILSRDNPNKEIGNSLKAAREHDGLSLKDAHKLLGTTECALEAIEVGEMEAPLSVVQKAVGLYGIPSDFIIGSTTQVQDAVIPAALFTDIRFLLICQEIHKKPELIKIFSMLNRLQDKDLVRLSKVIELLVND